LKNTFTLFAAFVLIGILTINIKASPNTLKPKLSIALTQTKQKNIQVELSFLGSSEGETILKLNDWGGINNLSTHFQKLHVTDHSGVKLKVVEAQDGEWLVTHQTNEKLVVTYELLANDNQSSDTSEGYYRPIVNDQLFHAVGHNFLTLPTHLKGEIEVNLQWYNFEGQSTLTSLGSSLPKFNTITSLDNIYQSLFVAASLKIEERTINGRPLTVSLHGDNWQFKFEEFVDLTETVTQAQRDYFDDHDFPFYWINVISTGKPMKQGYSFGGTRLHDNFALFLNPSTQLEYDTATGSPIVHLLMHEMMHVWIGGKLTPDTEHSDEGTYYWFSEGFTNYFTRQVLLQSGLLTQQQYEASLNDVFKKYNENPVNAASNQEIADNFWKSRNHQLLPYQRGDLIALYLDHMLQDTRLKQLLVQWIQDEKFRNFKLNDFYNSVKTLLPKHAFEKLKLFIESGQLPDWSDLNKPNCMNISHSMVYEWASGFDHQSTLKSHIITGVKADSAAYKAGLRDGQKLTSISMHYGDTSKNVSVGVEGMEEPMLYLPVGNGIKIPQVKLTGISCIVE